MFLPATAHREFLSFWIFSCNRNDALAQGPYGMNEIFYSSNTETRKKKKKEGNFFLQETSFYYLFFISNLVQASTFRICCQSALIHCTFSVSDFQFPTCPFRDTNLPINLADCLLNPFYVLGKNGENKPGSCIH